MPSDVMVSSACGPLKVHLRYQRNWLGQHAVLKSLNSLEWAPGNVRGIPFEIETLEDLDMLLAEIAESQGQLRMCHHASDLSQCIESGIAGVYLTANFNFLGQSVDRIRLLRVLGVLTFALSPNQRSLLVDGCGERNASGLSDLGVRVVEMLQRERILVDVSHVSDRGFWDVVEMSSQPILASHSNSRSLCLNPRNVTDEQARAVARLGGCIGISVHSSLISQESPSLARLVDHIEHFVNLVGDEAVCLGTDFIHFVSDFIVAKLRLTGASKGIYHHDYVKVDGLETFDQMRGVIGELARRGFSQKVAENIAYRNLLRLFRGD
jgi:membrane dipeptidase